MKVILVRHAKSDYDWVRWPSDSVRPLSEKGKLRQIKVAKGMIQKNIRFDESWVSPYTRAQQTLEIIQQYQPTDVPVKINKELPPFGDPEKIYIQLRDTSKNSPSKSILLVGHNPNISELLELLAGTPNVPEMRTSDVAICEINGEESKLIKYYSRSELYNDD